MIMTKSITEQFLQLFVRSTWTEVKWVQTQKGGCWSSEWKFMFL